MPKFRKKPVVIEAVRYLGNGDVEGNPPRWMWDGFEDGTLKAVDGTDPLVVVTKEGPLTVRPGWWIIRGVAGELYPCDPDIFAKTYDKVEEE